MSNAEEKSIKVSTDMLPLFRSKFLVILQCYLSDEFNHTDENSEILENYAVNDRR